MQIPIVIAVGTVLFAVCSGRSLSGLASLRLRHTWILFVVLAIQAFFVVSPPAWLDVNAATRVYVATLGVVAVFLILNRRTTGLSLVALGLALNGIVILANGAMPVSSTAASFAGAELLTDQRHIDHGTHLRNEPLAADTRLGWMGDTIPFPGLRIVTSPGDLIIAAGLIRLVWSRTSKKSIEESGTGSSYEQLDPFAPTAS